MREQARILLKKAKEIRELSTHLEMLENGWEREAKTIAFRLGWLHKVIRIRDEYYEVLLVKVSNSYLSASRYDSDAMDTDYLQVKLILFKLEDERGVKDTKLMGQLREDYYNKGHSDISHRKGYYEHIGHTIQFAQRPEFNIVGDVYEILKERKEKKKQKKKTKK